MENSLHGEQISVTTLTIAKIQEKFLKLSNFQVKISDIDFNYFEKIFDQDLAIYFWEEFSNKIINDNHALEINKKLNDFHKLSSNLIKDFTPYDKIKKISDRFNLVQLPMDIGLNQEIYSEAIKNANLIRNRFTILDLFII